MKTQHVRTDLERLAPGTPNTVQEHKGGRNWWNTGGEGKSALIFCSGVQLTRKNNDLRLVSKTCRTIPGELGWQEKYSFVVCPGKKNQRYQCRHVNTWNNMKRANSFELWQLKRDNWERQQLPDAFWTKICQHTYSLNSGRKMGLNTCNIRQALAILQPAIFHKLAKANFIMECQSRGTESTM